MNTNPEDIEAGEHKQDELPHETDRYFIPGIEVRHRKVNRWLIVVYVALGLWGLYYLITRWGGLGPGLSLT